MTAAVIDVEGELAVIAGRLNVQHALLVDVTARALAEGGRHGVGIVSPAQWLTIQLGVAPGVATRIVRIAERIGEFPVLRDTFGRGELSLDQVFEVATKAPAWADQRITEFATACTVRQLRRMIRDEHFDGDPDEPPPPEAPPTRDRMSFGWDEHGRFDLHLHVGADQGAVIEAALRERRDAIFRGGDERVTWPQVMTDLCATSLQHAPSERSERFKSYLHVALDTGKAELDSGVPLPASVRDYLLCDGQIQPVWVRHNTPVGVGRSQRIVPDRLRRLVEHRDQTCVVPWCDCKIAEIHHIIHWSQGGPTETWNLAGTCKTTHGQIHRGELIIVGNADVPGGLTFTDRFGRQLDVHGKPMLPNGPPPDPDVGYRHPSGGRLDGRWIDWAHPNAMKRRAEQADAHVERERRERARLDAEWDERQRRRQTGQQFF